MDFLKRTWAEINLDHLSFNAAQIQSRLSEKNRMMAVVKANAYGHGDGFVAKELERLGIEDFGVSNLEEALSLRQKRVEGNILILGVTPVSEASKLAQNRIVQTIYSKEYAKELNDAAKKEKVFIDCHIKLDTGMGRIGFATGEGCGLEEIAEACSLSRLHITGVFSHLSSADDTSPEGVSYTKEQIKRFEETIAALEQRGIRFEIKHLQNSAGILNYPDCSFDLARAGIILYGLPLDTLPGREIPLKPVMSLYSVVAMVKTVQKGQCISYSRRFKADREMRIATVPIGYADGYLRDFGGKANMIVRGKYAKVVGSVCMDQLMLDVTHIPEVQAGDLVTVVGKDGDCQVTLKDLAKTADTIHYELACMVSRRVPRIYRKGDKIVGMADYITGEIEGER